MKFFDAFKIALHNIKNNKSRSILTVIIVMIVSTLIMGLTTFGIMFNNNSNAISKLMFDTTGTNMMIEGKIEENSQYYIRSFSKEEIKEIQNIMDNHSNLIDSAFFSGNCNSSENIRFSFADLKHLSVKSDNLIISGRIWNPNDANTLNIWVSDDLLKNASLEGKNYAVGDKLLVQLYAYNQMDKEPVSKSIDVELTIAGVYSYNAFNGYNKPSVIVDYRHFLEAFDFCIFEDITMNYFPPKVDYDFDELYGEFVEMNKEMTALLGINNTGGYERERFNCSIIEAMKMNRFMGLLIMGILVLLSFVVLLLSIGSVANTMIISVDKNRKFIGLMKALGLNQKGVKRSVSIESFVIIGIGILISGTLLFTVIQPLMVKTLTQIFSSALAYSNIEFTAVADIPFYVPFITLFCFYFMAKLSSRSSLKKIASQDVISTISEVA